MEVLTLVTEKYSNSPTYMILDLRKFDLAVNVCQLSQT